jgi:soluble lytic murein transglycosylase-like protein
MAANPGLANQIYLQAVATGIPPAIALAVAQQESGIQQTTSSGGLVTGSAGEIGVFQIMPATAVGLGVDPTDVSQNVQGGVSLLATLYAKYGNWPQALSAYNSGSPNGSPTYAASVLNLAGSFGGAPAAASIDDSGDDTSLSMGSPAGLDPNVVIIGALAAVLALVWWMD